MPTKPRILPLPTNLTDRSSKTADGLSSSSHYDSNSNSNSSNGHGYKNSTITNNNSYLRKIIPIVALALFAMGTISSLQKGGGPAVFVKPDYLNVKQQTDEVDGNDEQNPVKKSRFKARPPLPSPSVATAQTAADQTAAANTPIAIAKAMATPSPQPTIPVAVPELAPVLPSLLATTTTTTTETLPAAGAVGTGEFFLDGSSETITTENNNPLQTTKTKIKPRIKGSTVAMPPPKVAAASTKTANGNATIITVEGKKYKIYKQTSKRVENYNMDQLLPAHVTNPMVIIGGQSYNFSTTNETDLQRQLQAANVVLPLPQPIIIVGMPKAGTTSITEFFRKAYKSKDAVSHWKVLRVLPEILIGMCLIQSWNNTMTNNSNSATPTTTITTTKPTALQDCGNYKVWAQMDITLTPDDCYFPQITHLDAIHAESPNATFLLNRRNFTNWFSSVHRWKPPKFIVQGNYAERMMRCKDGPLTSSREDLILWHKEQIKRVRQFVFEHPSHALLELDIEDDVRTSTVLAKAFDASAHFWGQANANVEDPGPMPIDDTNKGGAATVTATTPKAAP